MELQKELKEIMDEYKINRISTIEEIDDIYDYEMMLKTNDLFVREEKVDEINIVLFDTEEYNSTYVLDVYKEFIDENGELLEHIKVHYCDNLSVYKSLFDKFWRKHGFVDLAKSTESNLVLKQVENIIPIVLVINGIDDEILVEVETINPITIVTFENLINELN